MINFDDKSKYNDYGSLLGYHNNEKLNSYNCQTNMLIGERACGKTYATLAFDCVKRFIDSDYNDQFAYIRRYDTEMALVAEDIFNGMVQNGWLSWYTKGKWNDIHYYRHKWWLRRVNDDGVVEEKCPTIMAYAFCINTVGKSKGPDRMNIKTIVFDEFIPINGDRGYVYKEVENWQNLISNIDRSRNAIKIYMLANTINKECPHFDHYKIDADKLEQGKIYVYKVGTKGKIAVQYCDSVKFDEVKESVYFNLDDRVGSMILTGKWETDDYPKLPTNIDLEAITMFKFYFVRKDKIIEGRFLATDGVSTIYFSMFNDLIEYKELVYVDEWYPDAINEPSIRVRLNTSRDIDRVILQKIQDNRCYYENDDIGEKVRYFISL